jgi:hypothetical protein
MALNTIPENSGSLDLVLKLLHVRKALAAVVLQVFNVENSISYAYIIPEIATSITSGAGRNERWIVNSHIDLATWNDVYN